MCTFSISTTQVVTVVTIKTMMMVLESNGKIVN